MVTENIIFFPHCNYNISKEKVCNLRVNEYINYGYVKLRNLRKWLNGENVAVKMGMLTPSNKRYLNETILNSALIRIKEQDNTSCFEDDDELVPIYIFVSKDTDNEWRDFLINKGYNVARKNALREGVIINRENLSLCYAERYNIDTLESLTLKEKRRKKQEEIHKKQQEIYNNIIEQYKNYIIQYDSINGVGSYIRDKEKQEVKLKDLNIFKIDYKTLNIYYTKECLSPAGKLTKWFLAITGMIAAFLGIFLLTFNFFNLVFVILIVLGGVFVILGGIIGETETQYFEQNVKGEIKIIDVIVYNNLSHKGSVNKYYFEKAYCQLKNNC